VLIETKVTIECASPAPCRRKLVVESACGTFQLIEIEVATFMKANGWATVDGHHFCPEHMPGGNQT
jgi:hypothetical protein